jgi:hypothetical protein
MPVAEQVGTLVESNRDFNNPAALRDSMRENGYLYFRGLGPKDRILALRKAMLEICAEAGWVDDRYAPVTEAPWSGAGPYTESEPEYMAVYKRIVHLPLFNELPADPFYMGLMEKVVDGPVMMHRMHIGRVSFPNNTVQTTPAHQDWQYIRGTPNTYTIWTPIGDCPVEVGGLKVLRGSHKRGYVEHALLPEQKYAGWGLWGEKLEATGGAEWQTAAYTVGDCVIFHSHTVHGAMPNLSGDRLRLSVDNRYQRQGDEYGSAATRTHHDL